MTEKKETSLLDVVMEHWPFSAKADEISFQSHGFLTLGAEMEMQLIDPETLNLVLKAEELIADGKGKLKPEVFLSQLEINTEKRDNVHDIESDLSASLDTLIAVAKQHGVELATTGCHPFFRHSDNIVSTASPRYHDLIDRNQWLARRSGVFGLHVHIGMKNGDGFIRFHNFFLNFLPHLIALSASSPFWQGNDTGLASCRSTVYEAMPTSGHPYQVRSWREFEALYHTLKKCDAIRSLKDLWWDMRPSPKYGTLEIRICDGPATLAEATAITAYIHLLAHWFNDNGDWLDQVPPPPLWLARENKWRAMRYGLDANLVTNLEGDTQLVRQSILEWLDKLEPYIEKLQYRTYAQTLRDICLRGNSASRQRQVFQRMKSLQDVVKFNIREFIQRAPIWAPGAHQEAA